MNPFINTIQVDGMDFEAASINAAKLIPISNEFASLQRPMKQALARYSLRRNIH